MLNRETLCVAFAGALFVSSTAFAGNDQCSPAALPAAPELTIVAAALVADPAAHCKIDGVIGDDIKFSLWLPENWNGKFVMGGQGGFAGSVDSQALDLGAFEKGYAVAGTDTGHAAHGIDARWALGRMDRIVNYGHLAVHRTTVTAKFIAQHYYGRAPVKSYFAGCSNGGRQGLMSAQRYPEDFDAIVAGAPALDFNGIVASFVNAVRANFPDPSNLSNSLISRNEAELLGKAVLGACDKDDGLEDGVLGDPDACRFDFKEIACKGRDTDQCLSRAEQAAVRSIYRGPEQAGRQYGHRLPFGGEGHAHGWPLWLLGAKDAIASGVPSLGYAYGVGYMRNFIMQDPDWSYDAMDFASLEERGRLVQGAVSPIDADLSAFRKHGGKLLMYHGWADPGLSPYMSTDYVDRVYANDETARGDVRLFMLPGVLHCSFGAGPDKIDYLDAIDRWSSGANAPTSLEAAFSDGSGARKVCAYPAKQRFLGGDGKSPDQFACD